MKTALGFWDCCAAIGVFPAITARHKANGRVDKFLLNPIMHLHCEAGRGAPALRRTPFVAEHEAIFSFTCRPMQFLLFSEGRMPLAGASYLSGKSNDNSARSCQLGVPVGRTTL